MGVMLMQCFDFWNVVIVQVFLLDMLCFYLLLVGVSWVGEYGFFDVFEECEWLEVMLLYYNFDVGIVYLEFFFVILIKDDRVYFGYVCKMVKLFEVLGKFFLYYENIDGGYFVVVNQ